MPLGWIDFSKSERNKVLSVLDLLSEAGTLDELGIGPIRDGFSNLFFPGTSTIQTRAKYFLIVPYALKDLEYSSESNPRRILRALDELEKECAVRLLENTDDVEGIIGNRSLRQGRWVKRTPSVIYWSGLRNYGIFTGGTLSLSEYVSAMCKIKKRNTTLIRLGNRHDRAEEGEQDDKDAGERFRMQFWKIPTYTDDWLEDLSIDLTPDEGAFLKEQIVTSHPDSMLAFILKNECLAVLECDSFQDLSSLMQIFPEQIQADYHLAASFSDFMYVLRTIFNLIISDWKNQLAVEEWERLQPKLLDRSNVDLDSIFERLQVRGNVSLCRFLQRTETLMATGDLEGMQREIRRRERELKQSRAKTMRPGELNPDDWYGGRELDYRFSDARVIMKDIFESEGLYAKSES